MAIREWRNEGLSPLGKLAGRAFLFLGDRVRAWGKGDGNLREKLKKIFAIYAGFNGCGAFRFAMGPHGPQVGGSGPRNPITLRKKCKSLQKFTGMWGCCGVEIGCGDLGKKTFTIYASFNGRGAVRSAMGPRGPQVDGIRSRNPIALRKKCKFLQKFTGMRHAGQLRACWPQAPGGYRKISFVSRAKKRYDKEKDM